MDGWVLSDKDEQSSLDYLLENRHQLLHPLVFSLPSDNL